MVLPGPGSGAAASTRLPHLPQKRSSTGTWFPQLGQDFVFIRSSNAGTPLPFLAIEAGALVDPALPASAIPREASHSGHRVAPRLVSVLHRGQTRPTDIVSPESCPPGALCQ